MAHTTPLISIILPTCDRPRLLARALESCAAQDYRPFEVLVCNDGREDISSVVAVFADRLDIQVPSKDLYLGLAANRNVGLQAARGDYIAYLDDDDLLYPDHLSSLLAHMQEQKAAVAFSDAYRSVWRREGDQLVCRRRDLPFTADFDPRTILVRNLFPVLAVMHERRCYEMVGGFDEELHTHEDWDMWIRLSRLYSFSHLRHITCEFTQTEGGDNMTVERRSDFLRSMDIIYQRYHQLVADQPDLLAAQKRLRQRLQWQVNHPVLSRFRGFIRHLRPVSPPTFY